MSDNIANLHFTGADIDRWVEMGIITPDQAQAIRWQVQQSPPLPVAPPPPPQKPQSGLNVITVAYYFGSFMILLAYTFFLGLSWSGLGHTMQFVVAIFTVGILAAIGALLRNRGFIQPGNLLIFAATGITPLVAFTFAQLLGLWPQYPGFGSPGYDDFYRTVRPYWVFLELFSLLVATIVLWITRFPLITLLMAFWTWYLSMDLARWAGENNNVYSDDREQIVSILVGFAMLALGLFLQRRTRDDYSRWFYLFGHIVLLIHLSVLTYQKEGLLGLLFIIIYVGFVVASVWLQRTVFLVFGALGCYGYLSYLSFKTFSGAIGFPIALAFIGLLIVLTTVGYQKYARAWLDQRLSKYRLHSQPTG
jgi:hypothetical protein